MTKLKLKLTITILFYLLGWTAVAGLFCPHPNVVAASLAWLWVISISLLTTLLLVLLGGASLRITKSPAMYEMTVLDPSLKDSATKVATHLEKLLEPHRPKVKSLLTIAAGVVVIIAGYYKLGTSLMFVAALLHHLAQTREGA